MGGFVGLVACNMISGADTFRDIVALADADNYLDLVSKSFEMPIENDDDKLSTEFEERLAYLEGLLPEVLEHLRFFRRYKAVMQKRIKAAKTSKTKPRRRRKV